jgi:hypothetical protein
LLVAKNPKFVANLRHCCSHQHVAAFTAPQMALTERAQSPGTPADWLVRTAHNRCLPEGDPFQRRPR